MVKSMVESLPLEEFKKQTWRCLRSNWMWHSVPWVSWRAGDDSKVALDDLRGLFHPKLFCDCVFPLLSLFVSVCRFNLFRSQKYPGSILN